MKTLKKVILTIFVLFFLLIFIKILITPDLSKYYFTGVGCVTTIAIILLLFLIGVWLGRGRKAMTSKEQGTCDEETTGLLVREDSRREIRDNFRRKEGEGFKRKERQDSRRRDKWKPKQA
jgi:hypothetical protein